MRHPLYQSRPAMGLAAILLCAACQSTAAPTPPALPTLPPPRVVTVEPAQPPPSTPAPPSSADLTRVAVLLDHWALGAPVAARAAVTPVSRSPGGDYFALPLDGAPVVTQTAGVQVQPALLLAVAGGAGRRTVSTVSAGLDHLSPIDVAWASSGAAALLFSWQTGGRTVAVRPLLLVDQDGVRHGPMLLVPATAGAPLWNADGRYLAYVDAGTSSPQVAIVDAAGGARVQGPANAYECARCWPDLQWAPGGSRLAYATTESLAPVAGQSPLGHLTWRLLVLDAATQTVLFDQRGTAVEEAHVLGWDDPGQVQVVLRRSLVPADQITGQQGQWRDTAYHLRLDPPPARLVPATP